MRLGFILEFLLVAVITTLITCSCSLKQFYPTGGAMIGGGLGSIAGPAGAVVGSGGGALLGEVARGNAEIEEARQTITSLSQGDVEALVSKGLTGTKADFEGFAIKIQRILLIVGVCLIIYLVIPVFVAKRCAETEAKKSLTRAPFPVKPPK